MVVRQGYGKEKWDYLADIITIIFVSGKERWRNSAESGSRANVKAMLKNKTVDCE